MNLKNHLPPLHIVVAIPVVLIILSALALSAEAVVENLRFVRAADRVLELVSTVRTVAAGQKGFAQNPGEDVWADLEHVGQIIPSDTHPNPWGGDTRMVTVANQAMRIESDVPRHDCRRLALYFLARQPSELGLLSIEAQAAGATAWGAIYPVSATYKNDDVVAAACGHASYARLALVFQIR
jgi:hypothetical protein